MQASLPSLVVLLLAATGCQVVPKVTAMPRYGTRDVSGDFLISTGGGSMGADAEAMGLDEDDGVFYPRVDLSWLGFDAFVGGSNAVYAGEGILEETFDLGGVTIMASDAVRSRLDLTHATAGITWDLVPSDLVDVGLGIGVAYFDFEAEIQSLTTMERIMTAEEFVMPVLAARVEVELGPVRANVVGSGLTGSYGDATGTYVDLDGFLEYHLTELVGFHLGIVAGYSLSIFDFEYDDVDGSVDADLRFQGPYLGLTLGN